MIRCFLLCRCSVEQLRMLGNMLQHNGINTEVLMRLRRARCFSLMDLISHSSRYSQGVLLSTLMTICDISFSELLLKGTVSLSDILECKAHNRSGDIKNWTSERLMTLVRSGRAALQEIAALSIKESWTLQRDFLYQLVLSGTISIAQAKALPMHTCIALESTGLYKEIASGTVSLRVLSLPIWALHHRNVITLFDHGLISAEMLLAIGDCVKARARLKSHVVFQNILCGCETVESVLRESMSCPIQTTSTSHALR